MIRRWYVIYLKGGKQEREIIEAASALGAAAKFGEMHTDVDSKAVTMVILGDLMSTVEGLGLPPKKK